MFTAHSTQSEGVWEGEATYVCPSICFIYKTTDQIQIQFGIGGEGVGLHYSLLGKFNVWCISIAYNLYFAEALKELYRFYPKQVIYKIWYKK
jgi:hypothetical protein